MAKLTGDGAFRLTSLKFGADIISIELLEGDTEKTDAEVIQYVNIQQNIDKHTDMSHLNRFGQKLRFRVKFDKEGLHFFWVKLKLGASNSVYTTAEIGRNSNFKYSEGKINCVASPKSGTTFDLEYKVFVSPAGGDVFEITAGDMNGNIVTATSKIKTKRLMYYVEAKMSGLTSIASNLSTFTGEYGKQHIEFKSLGSVNIANMPNIGNNADSTTFKTRVQTAYASSNGPARAPYCVIIGYTGHLAVKDPDQDITPVTAVGGSATPVNVPIIGVGLTDRKALWNNIVPGEDWFVECYFLKNGGNVSTDKIIIPKNKCTPVQAAGYPAGYCDSVNVNISSLPADTGKIVMKVNWVNRMRGGLSFTGTNMVAICTKAWWKTITSNEQNQTIIHEVGHQLKMVANGTSVDKTPYHYTGKGHVGDHCHAGLSVMSNYGSALGSTCVMFGATNAITAFCSDCAKAVKKIDLKNGV